jgi:hypothetical protein
VIIGDFSVLTKGKVWRKFIDQAKLLTKTVGPEYVDHLARLCPMVGNQLGKLTGSLSALHFQQPQPIYTRPPSLLARQHDFMEGTSDQVSRIKVLPFHILNSPSFQSWNAFPECLPNAVLPHEQPIRFFQNQADQHRSMTPTAIMAQQQIALLQQQQQQHQAQEHLLHQQQLAMQQLAPTLEQERFWHILAQLQPPPPPPPPQPEPTLDQRLLELLTRPPPPPPSQPQPMDQGNEMPQPGEVQMPENQLGSLSGPYPLPNAMQPRMPQPQAQKRAGSTNHFFFQ